MLLTKDLLGHSFIGSAANYNFDNELGVIKNTSPMDEKDIIDEDKANCYVDVFVNGYIAYMDGEDCKLVDFTDNEVTLRNENNNCGSEEFTISKTHFDACFALSYV